MNVSVNRAYVRKKLTDNSVANAQATLNNRALSEDPPSLKKENKLSSEVALVKKPLTKSFEVDSKKPSDPNCIAWGSGFYSFSSFLDDTNLPITGDSLDPVDSEPLVAESTIFMPKSINGYRKQIFDRVMNKNPKKTRNDIFSSM
jgi:hypothetical protein